MIELRVNGVTRRVLASKNMPLLWALRDVLKLKGTKFGCGRALCGACTVHVDGVAVRSCTTPVSAAIGKQVTTIEGVPESHPVKEAWRKHNVPQCGYCQPGQIMSAVAFLSGRPAGAAPSDPEIAEAMNGNICRCGTYPRIRAAIREAAGGRG